LERSLDEKIGKDRLGDTKPAIIVSAFDIRSGTPYFFKSQKAKEDLLQNHFLSDVAMATASAPTYFPPWPRGDKVLIDGMRVPTMRINV
jgi:patatin-like phospholipase/acyl hydrolase